MGLRSFVMKRMIYSFILLLLVIGLNFAIFKSMPGDPVAFLLQPYSKENPAEIEKQRDLIRNLWGFDQPVHIQLAKYTRNLLSFEFGVTFVGKRPIGQVMTQKIPYTLLLLGGAAIFSIAFGVLWGIAVIQRRGGLFDSGSIVSSLFLGSLPTFWLGLMFLLILTNTLRWFPGAGPFPKDWAGNYPVVFTISDSNSSPDALRTIFSINAEQAFTLVSGYLYHLFLPLLTVIVFSIGGWLLLTRATMIEVIAEDYIVTARAKGLKERTVLFKHALKNASLPIITNAALSFGFIFTGAIITETVFSYPGLGAWIFFDAIPFLDYAILMAIFYVISICVIVANIVADLLYGVIDPRIKYG